MLLQRYPNDSDFVSLRVCKIPPKKRGSVCSSVHQRVTRTGDPAGLLLFMCSDDAIKRLPAMSVCFDPAVSVVGTRKKKKKKNK